MQLLKWFLSYLPALLVIVVAVNNPADVTMDLFGYKATLALGWPIGIAGWLGIVFGTLSARETTINQIKNRLYHAKIEGKLDALLESPEATKPLEAIIGRL